MARDFDGSTDRIDYSNIWNPAGQAQSISFWLYPSDTGAQYFFITHPAGDASFIGGGLFWNPDVDGRVAFISYYDDTNLGKDSAAGAISMGSWGHFLVTYAGGTAHAGVHIYFNGSELSYGLEINGIGSSIAGTGKHSIGGRIYSDDRNTDGRFAEFGWWDRVLDAGEIAALAKGYSPRFFPNGLVFAPDLIREQRDLISGKVGTLDGTTVVSHPRVIIPSKIWVPHQAVGGIAYEDLLLGVSVSASVLETDTQQMLDIEKDVSIAASVSESDTQQMLDTNKAVSFAASVSVTDTQQMVDTNLGVTVVASLNVTGNHQMVNTSLGVSFAASITETDNQQMVDLLKDVSFAASISETDTQQMKDLLKAITFAASCSIETEVYYDASAVVVAMFAFIISRQHTS